MTFQFPLEAESEPKLQGRTLCSVDLWYLPDHPATYLPSHPAHVAHVRERRLTRASQNPKQCLIVKTFWDNRQTKNTDFSQQQDQGRINKDGLVSFTLREPLKQIQIQFFYCPWGLFWWCFVFPSLLAFNSSHLKIFHFENELSETNVLLWLFFTAGSNHEWHK